jgi:hypothetical protein
VDNVKKMYDVFYSSFDKKKNRFPNDSFFNEIKKLSDKDVELFLDIFIHF